jgi:hypothetical protein
MEYIPLSRSEVPQVNCSDCKPGSGRYFVPNGTTDKYANMRPSHEQDLACSYADGICRSSNMLDKAIEIKKK